MTLKDLEKRITKLEPVHHKPNFNVPLEHIKNSMESIGETIENADDDTGDPLLDWMGAELKDDRKTADELKNHPDVKKYRIFGED